VDSAKNKGKIWVYGWWLVVVVVVVVSVRAT